MSHLTNKTISAVLSSSMTRPPAVDADAMRAVALHVESKMRRVVEDARKLMRHGRRKVLTARDINRALRLHTLSPVIGYSEKEPIRFVYAGDDNPFTNDSSTKFRKKVKALHGEIQKRRNDAVEIRRQQRKSNPKVDLKHAEGKSDDAFTVDREIDKCADLKTEAIEFCFRKMKEFYPLDTLRQRLVDAGVADVPQLVPSRFYFARDPKVNVGNLSDVCVPSYPLDPTLHMHWLAVEGVQPRIPENEKQSFEDALSEPGHIVVPRKHSIQTSSRVGKVNVKLHLKHTLSEEHVLYFQKVRQALFLEEGSTLEDRQNVLKSLACDNGLQQLVPYLSKFIVENVTRILETKPRPKNSLTMLQGMVLAVSSLLRNSYINLEFYLQQLMPMVLSCQLHKKICRSKSDPHWELRDAAAQVVADICRIFGDRYTDLPGRVTETYYRAMIRKKTPLTTHYGAIVGVYWLGPRVMEKILMPLYEDYNAALEHFLESPKESHRAAAQRCIVALKRAVGSYMQFKMANDSSFKKESFRAHLASLKAGTSPFNAESMMPFLHAKTSSAASSAAVGAENGSDTKTASAIATGRKRTRKGMPAEATMDGVLDTII